MNRVLAPFIALLVSALIVNAAHAAGTEEWSFVWVSSTTTDWDIIKGVATVKRTGVNFVAEATGENTVKYRIVGKIEGRSIAARFTILESEFANAPFVGTYTKRKDKGINLSFPAVVGHQR